MKSEMYLGWAGFLLVAGLLVVGGCAQEDASILAVDTTPPVVGAVVEDGGRIAWETEEDCRCVLLYGVRQGIYHHYGYSVHDGGRSHYVDLLDVQPGNYFVRVMATDRAGNASTSDEMLFEVDQIASTDNLIYTMVDVGWGDCHFLEFPSGTNVMVDAGYGTIGEYEHTSDVNRFLEARGVKAPSGIDYMVATHNHGDHYGGFLDLLPRFRNTRFLAPKYASSSVWNSLKNVLASTNVERDSLVEGQTNRTVDYLNWDEQHGAEVEVLSAGAGRFFNPEQSGDPINNDSVVLKVTFGEVDILLEADAEEFVEQRMLRTYGHGLDCDILKVGHHGNDDASSAEFLDLVSPRVGLIPNSMEENPGVFDQSVITRLLADGIDYYVSDRAYRNGGRYDEPEHGNVTVTTDGESYTVWCWE